MTVSLVYLVAWAGTVKQTVSKNFFVLSIDSLITVLQCWDPDPGLLDPNTDPLVRGMDPGPDQAPDPSLFL